MIKTREDQLVVACWENEKRQTLPKFHEHLKGHI